MKIKNNDPIIFLSYSWADTAIANEIDKDFQSLGILVKRDVRNALYRAEIKIFMQSIRECDFAIVLISDAFLKSDNCLYELLELFNSNELESKIAPMILEGVQIYKEKDRVKYYEYWDGQIVEFTKLARKHLTIDIQEKLNHIKNIRNNLPELLKIISGYVTHTFTDLRADGYAALLNFIGFSEKTIYLHCSKVYLISDTVERDLALERLIEKYGENKFVLKLRADVAVEKREFGKAESLIKRAIVVDSESPMLHYNYAVLLSQYLNKIEESKVHYLKAIKYFPGFIDAHINYALLCQDNFDEAEKHYLYIIENYPNLSESAHVYYAILLEKYFRSKLLIKKHYNKAIELNPLSINAYANYADFLQKDIIGIADSFELFEKALEINPNHVFTLTKYTTALLTFHGYLQAKPLIERLMSLIPDDPNVFLNYGIILELLDKDYEAAKFNYQKALDINPNFAGAYLNLGILYMEHEQEFLKAKKCFENAIEIEPTYITAYDKLTYLLSQHLKDEENAVKIYQQMLNVLSNFDTEKYGFTTIWKRDN